MEQCWVSMLFSNAWFFSLLAVWVARFLGSLQFPSGLICVQSFPGLTWQSRTFMTMRGCWIDPYWSISDDRERQVVVSMEHDGCSPGSAFKDTSWLTEVPSWAEKKDRRRTIEDARRWLEETFCVECKQNKQRTLLHPTRPPHTKNTQKHFLLPGKPLWLTQYVATICHEHD